MVPCLPKDFVVTIQAKHLNVQIVEYTAQVRAAGNLTTVAS